MTGIGTQIRNGIQWCHRSVLCHCYNMFILEVGLVIKIQTGAGVEKEYPDVGEKKSFIYRDQSYTQSAGCHMG